MIGSLFELLGRWKEVRVYAGFSYQVSRKGKRRVLPIDGYRKRGLADMQWIETGKFADERLNEKYFRGFEHTPRPPKRQRLAKTDFALTR